MQSFIDLLWSFIEYLKFAAVIDQYEKGIVLRFGKYHRTLEPGFHWLLPFGAEEVFQENVVTTTEHLETQTLDSSDYIGVIVCPVVTWNIADIRSYFLTSEDPNGVMIDKISSLLAETISYTEYEKIADPEFWNEVSIKSRRNCKKFGIHIDKVSYSDLSKVRTIRLIND